MDGIVHFIWIRRWVNNYPHSVWGIYHYQFQKEKNNFCTCSPCLPIHFVHLSRSFFFQSQNSVYILPHIFPSRGLCPWPTSCPSWECHCTRHLNFNCSDSCSIGVLMYSYNRAYVYSTSICDLLLFLIAEWSQLSRDYFHPSSTAMTYIVLTCCTKVCIFISFSVVERFQSFFVFSLNYFFFCQILFSRTYGKKHISDFLESERHIEFIMSP